MTRSSLLVSEVFGPTVQGEGPSLGRRCGFIRLGLCNLDCRWCDTPYTWDRTRFDLKAELAQQGLVELVDQVVAMGVGLVVVSGGEPLVQRKGLAALAALLRGAGLEVEVETNGTIAPPADLARVVSRWNVSPKLEHSGVDADRRFVPDALRALVATRRAAFKFVAQDPADLFEVQAMVDEVGIDPATVWVMPEGVTPATVACTGAELADAVVARGWNLTTRLHVLTWGNRRGV